MNNGGKSEPQGDNFNDCIHEVALNKTKYALWRGLSLYRYRPTSNPLQAIPHIVKRDYIKDYSDPVTRRY